MLDCRQRNELFITQDPAWVLAQQQTGYFLSLMFLQERFDI